MKAAVFAYSAQGCRTALKVRRFLDDCSLYTIERLADQDFSPISRPSRPFYGELFSRMDALIFVGACGIAVREIAPFVRDKKTDPAVLSVDELGQFVIPLLSGHIGGANALAVHLAGQLGAVPVVTTATDINHKFSVDAWASSHNCVIDSMALAKAVSAAILQQDLPLQSDFPVTGVWPGGIFPGETGELGVCISVRRRQPFEKTLRLIPRILHLGIGCRRGTERAAIEQAVRTVLEEHNLDFRAVRCVCSIDLKKEEQGLLEFCQAHDLPVEFYTAAQLNETAGDFTPSEFVRKTTGTDNVCERAALHDAERLLVKKTVCSGVTVAVAEEKMEVSFGESNDCGHRPRK